MNTKTISCALPGCGRSLVLHSADETVLTVDRFRAILTSLGWTADTLVCYACTVPSPVHQSVDAVTGLASPPCEPLRLREVGR